MYCYWPPPQRGKVGSERGTSVALDRSTIPIQPRNGIEESNAQGLPKPSKSLLDLCFQVAHHLWVVVRGG